MLISKMIEELQKIKEEVGDIEVYSGSDGYEGYQELPIDRLKIHESTDYVLVD